ncbi:MAG: hypothetical protein LH616_04365 [Ilumatobacteraceae bacterium]|nr:hypothetical protein [Ilumatobacteraceae bacterium]
MVVSRGTSASSTANVGIFEGLDSDEGSPMFVRCTWTVADADHARWQQAFTRDERDWETNWIMDVTQAD